jgi:hypothetical protein
MEADHKRRWPFGAVGWIALGIAVVVIVSTVAVLLLGNRPAASFAADSPEAALQSFLAAWEADDLDTAYSYFSDRVQAQVSLEEYVRARDDYYVSDTDRTVELDRTTGDGDRRQIHLTVEEFYGAGLGSGSYAHEETVNMVREAEGWKVDESLAGLQPYYPSEFSR